MARVWVFNAHFPDIYVEVSEREDVLIVRIKEPKNMNMLIFVNAVHTLMNDLMAIWGSRPVLEPIL